MRHAPHLLTLLALAACGDTTDGPTACEVGPDIVRQAVGALLDSQPACVRDEDCVSLSLRVSCPGYEAGGCGSIVHRDAAARWDAAAVCRDIAEASRPGELSCSEQASCVGRGAPVCRAGSCAGASDRQ